MVCVANEVKLKCVVCDGDEKSVLFTFTLPTSTSMLGLHLNIAKLRKCPPFSFEIYYNEINLLKDNYISRSFLELFPDYVKQATEEITIVIHDVPKVPIQKLWEDVYIAFNKDTNGKELENCYKPTPGISTRSVDFVNSQPTKTYVGLVNQAMTCYLNSLLQALYMTPEFRNALYNWEYSDGSDKDQSTSIPYQLQKLFLSLQTSTKPAVETTSLTKSFGWDSSEAWQQHDIQELCRVMFDALEKKFKNTEHSNLINRLYEGKMIDYVKCLNCKTEKTREDTFLDIPLPLRSFDSTTAYESVEEALNAFVKYETLDGNNQYHCEKCNEKCDAHKGLKFTKFPYILTLHLKRFDFDYKTLFRVKLNDRVTFPYYLDLNSFIEKPVSKESPCLEEDAGMSVKFDDTSTTDSGTVEDDCPPCNNVAHDQENDEGIDMSNGIATTNGIANSHETVKNIEKCPKDNSPYIYDLFSIMIHNGGASGGHYYAYIKDFTTNQWLCFNDTTVNTITDSHIERVYGGGPTKAYSSSTNAYMLMYRQIDPTKNDVPMQEKDFPEHIKLLLEKMKESEDTDKNSQVRIELFRKVEVYCNHPRAKKLMMKWIRLGQYATFAELKEKAYEKFSLYGDVDLDQCRLVFYDARENIVIKTYNGNERTSIGEIFKRYPEDQVLLLEIREKDQEFESYKLYGTPLKVCVIDSVNEDFIDGPFCVRGHHGQSGAELKQQLSKIINIEPQNMSVYKRDHLRTDYNLFDDEEILQHMNLEVSYKIFVITPVESEESGLFKILNLIDKFQTIMWLHIQLPDIDKDYTEELQSLTLESKEETVANEPIDSDSIESVDKEVLSQSQENSTDSIEKNSNDQTNGKCESVMPVENFDVVDGLKEKCSINNSNENNVKCQGLESASEDSSLSDSEKTLVDNSSVKNNSSYDIDKLCQKYSQSNDEPNYYFKSTFDTSEGTNSLLKVYADYRTPMKTLRKKLEKFVGVPSESFNICTQQNLDSSEAEAVGLNNKLDFYSNGQRFSIVLDSALRKNEIKLKFYVLSLTSTHEPHRYLMTHTTSQDMTVAQVKKIMIDQVKRKCNVDIPMNRLRFREKLNTFMSDILFNDMQMGSVFLNKENEIVIQELQEDETVFSANQTVLFVRHWSRSTLELQSCQEIVFERNNLSDMMEKIATLSNIPRENLEIALGKGDFPCDCRSWLNLDSELNWRTESQENERTLIKLYVGIVILYRNSQEPLKKLNPEETAEFMKSERLLSYGSGIPNYYSHRREKPLKIYFNSDCD